LAKIRIPVHEIYAKSRATQKLLDDAKIDVESWLASKVATAMLVKENHAFINGDGNGKPRGLLSYPTVAGDDVEWGKLEHVLSGEDGAFIDGDVLIDVSSRLKPGYLDGAVWLMSRTAQMAVRKLKDKVTGSYLWQPALLSGAPNTLLGHPVVVADDMPAFAKGSLSVAFGNFQHAYQIVDHSGMHVLRDPYSAKPYVEFYTTRRVGGDVVNFEAVKLIKFSEG
jgi:HK97 family phage major capsid protein